MSSPSNKIKIAYSISMGLLIVIAIFCTFQHTFGDFDIFFHLKYGEYFVNHLTWNIDHSMFSWTPTDKNWFYINWLSASIFYLLHKISPDKALFLFKWVLMFLTCALYFINFKKDELLTSRTLYFLFFLIMLTPFGLMAKPETLSILFFSLTVFIFYYYKSTGKSLYKYYLPIFFLWVNSHGAFAVGLVFLFTSQFFELLLNRKDKFIVKHSVYAFLSLIVTFINPKGIKYHIEILNLMLHSSGKNAYSTIGGYVSGWSMFTMSPASNNMMFLPYMTLVISFAIIIFLFIKHFKTIDKKIYVHYILLLIFFLFSMLHIRNLIYYALVFLFSADYLTTQIKSINLLPVINSKWIRYSHLVLILLIVSRFLVFSPTYTWFGFGSKKYLPTKEIAFIKQNNLPKPMFNDFQTGSYMIWKLFPEYKVFIDTRFGPYQNGVYKDYLDMLYGKDDKLIEKYTKKYGFKSAIVALDRQKLVQKFLESPDWRLVFADSYATVFIKEDLFKTFTPKQEFVFNVKQFKELKDPILMCNLFFFTSHFSPLDAAFIRDTYAKNVPLYYYYRKEHLKWMDKQLLKIIQFLNNQQD